MLEAKQTKDAVERLGTDRFLVRRALGHGSSGQVYEAFDRERDDIVAVKLLRSHEAEEVAAWQDLVARLKTLDHPNLVRLYEVCSESEAACVVMEWLEGADLVRHLRSRCRRSASGRVNGIEVEEVRGCLRQLGSALAALHGAGLLHLNLKPTNVLRRASGELVLLDPLTGTSEGIGGGSWTPSAYCAPELVEAWQRPENGGPQPGPASDLFSCGVLLYEALTGIVPGAGRGRRPGERSPGVPDDLDRLCAELLQPDPRRRPSVESLLEIAHDPRDPRSALSSSTGPEHAAPPFVGRREELARLLEARQRLASGSGGLLWIRGTSGIGKTALLEQFLRELGSSRQELVLVGRSYRQSGSAYEPFRDIVPALRAELTNDPGAAAAAGSALRRLFPDLGRSRSAEELRGVSPESLRDRAFVEMRAVLEALARRRPVLLVLEDLQWADRDSARLFLELVRSPRPPYLVLASFRPEERDDSAFLSSLEPQASEAPTLELDTLGESESRELARLLVDRGAPTLGGATDQVERIVRAAQGDPFAVTALAFAAHRNPESFEGGVLAAQIEALDAPERALIELAAVAERPLHRATAELALAGEENGHGGGPSASSIELLEREGLLRVTGGPGNERLEPRHDRVRQAALEQLAPQRRRLRHRQLARALEGASGELDAATVAAHYRETEEESRAVRYALEAAEQALEQLAFDRAARLLELSLELGSGGVDSARVRARLGDTLALAGRGAEAAAVYLDAIREGSTSRVVALQLRAAEQLLTSGHVERGLRILRHVFRTLELPLPRGESPSRWSGALRRLWQRARGLSFDWRDEESVGEQERLQVDAYWCAAVGLRAIDPAAASDTQSRHLQAALAVGEPRRVVRAFTLEILSSSAGGTRSRHRTERLLRATTDLARDAGDPESLARAALASVMAAVGVGDWSRAVQVARQAETLLEERCAGVAWERRTNEDLLLQGLNGLGAFREIAQRVPQKLAEAREYDDRHASTLLGIWWARSLLIDDRLDEAAAELRTLEDRLDAESELFPRLNAWLVRLEVSLYGDDAQVWVRLQERWADIVDWRMLESQLFRIRLRILRARAALVRARHVGQPEALGLRHAAEKDLDAIERERAPGGRALALALRGSLAEHDGDRARAGELWSESARWCGENEIRVLADICRHRRGEVTPGSEGERLCEASRASMLAAGVGCPQRLCDLFVPRF